MTLYIKYMVSLRCKILVSEKLRQLGLNYFTVNLGQIKVLENITDKQLEQLKSELLKSGLELMDDKRAIVIEKIKNVIIDMIHHTDELPKVKFSIFLSEELDYDYTYLANLFSQTEGITIQQFILNHKIERIKELIIYNELSLSEISFKLNYSSAAALSHQFKKVTGLTPTFYKHLKEKRKENLEKI